jgi:hypothetical protein
MIMSKPYKALLLVAWLVCIGNTEVQMSIDELGAKSRLAPRASCIFTNPIK